jgi:hypothetical protein
MEKEINTQETKSNKRLYIDRFLFAYTIIFILIHIIIFFDSSRLYLGIIFTLFSIYCGNFNYKIAKRRKKWGILAYWLGINGSIWGAILYSVYIWFKEEEYSLYGLIMLIITTISMIFFTMMTYFTIYIYLI